MKKSPFKKILEQEAIKNPSFSGDLKFFLVLSWLLFMMIIGNVNEQTALTVEIGIGLIFSFLALLIIALLNNRVIFKIATIIWAIIALSAIISVSIFWSAFSTIAWVSAIALLIAVIMAIRSLRIRLRLIAFELISSDVLGILTEYYGENRIHDHSEEIQLIMADIQEKKIVCFGLFIKLPKKIEFEKFKHLLRQNGRTTILRSFEFDAEGKMKMNYFISDDPLEFKPMQFPLTYLG